MFLNCKKSDSNSPSLQDACDIKTEILAPAGFEVTSVGKIDFNGSVQAFQFVTEQIGYALLTKNVGGYVEVFKTLDGGKSWFNLTVGIDQYARSMIFRDENFGIITVHDVTGCPPPNCLNKCVILKTENGGLSWEELEFEELNGILYHPKFDSEGNLFANMGSVIMKSIDAGLHWDTLYASDALGFSLLTYSFELYQHKIYASGKQGKILVIDTNGQLIKTIDTQMGSLWDVEVMDEDRLLVVGSGKVAISNDGGDNWETVYEKSARLIGFDGADQGLMFLEKSSCPTDVYQVNDLIASTKDGGLSWEEAQQTTTNLRISFSNSQKMGSGIWLFMIGNELFRIEKM
jgi:photosystem II stability/assembly factor-like uncharacterized protein